MKGEDRTAARKMLQMPGTYANGESAPSKVVGLQP